MDQVKAEEKAHETGDQEVDLNLHLQESQDQTDAQESQDGIPVTQKHGLRDNILNDLKCKVYDGKNDVFGDDEDIYESSHEESEEDGCDEETVTVLKDIEERMSQRSSLRNEIRKLNKEVKEAEEESIKKSCRMQAKKIEKENLEETKGIQEEKLGVDKEWDEEVKVEFKKIKLQVKHLGNEMAKLELNGTRLLGGGNKGFQFKTLEKIAVSEIRVTVFYPGEKVWENQPKVVREEALKVTNLEINSYGKALTEAAACIKNYEPKIEKEKEVGIVMLGWGKVTEIKDDDLVKVEITKTLGMLRIVMSRGKSKFGKIFICIPPQVKGNKIAMMKLVREIKEKYDKAAENTFVVQEAKDWAEEVSEQDTGEVGPVFFRFCLSSVVNVISPEDPQPNICITCGMMHKKTENCELGVDGQPSE